MRKQILKEAYQQISYKLYNKENGTISLKDEQIIKECSGFISLVKYSVLSDNEIKTLWENSNLRYM